MSKLFDTLEKIRENEAYQPQDHADKNGQPSILPKRSIFIGICLALVIIIAVISLSDLHFKSGPGSQAEKKAELPPASAVVKKETAPAVKNAELPPASAVVEKEAAPAVNAADIKPAVSVNSTEKSRIYTPATLQQWENELAGAADSAGRIILLNNIATYYIYHQQYWKGLTFLDRGLAMQPRSSELLINYAVALTEMGLYGAAAKYYEKAYDIDPAHPALAENLEIIKQAKIMEDRLAVIYGLDRHAPLTKGKR